MTTPVSAEGFLSRLSNIIQSEAYQILDKIEDKVGMLEQAVRECKHEMANADSAELEVRKQIIRLNGQIETAQNAIAAAKNEASPILIKGEKDGRLEEAKSLANDILDRVKPQVNQVQALTTQKNQVQANLDSMVAQKAHYHEYIETLENELGTLRARKQTAESLGKLQIHEKSIDGTGAMGSLERLKENVANLEAGIQAGEQMMAKGKEPSDLEKRKKAFMGTDDAHQETPAVDKLMAELGIKE